MINNDIIGTKTKRLLTIEDMVKAMVLKDTYFMAYQLNNYELIEEYKSLQRAIIHFYGNSSKYMQDNLRDAETTGGENTRTISQIIHFSELSSLTNAFFAVMPVKIALKTLEIMDKSDDFSEEQTELMTTITDEYLKLNKKEAV